MIVFDIETDALKLEDITKIHCICFTNLESGKQYICSDNDKHRLWDYGDNLKYAIDALNNADNVIGHNAIEYDIAVIQKFYPWFKPKNVIDTLVLSRLVEPDRKGRKLEHYATQFGLNKIQNEEWKNSSSIIIERCKSDVEITRRLFEYLAEKSIGVAADRHAWNAFQLESAFAKIHYQQKTKGWKFDKEKAQALVERLKIDLHETTEQLSPFLKKKCTQVARITKPFKKDGSLAQITKKYLPVYSTADSSVNALCFKTLSDEHGHSSMEGKSPKYLSSGNICGPFTVIQFDDINLASATQLKKLLTSLGWKPTEWNYKKGDRETKTSAKLTEESYDSLPGELGQLLARRNKIQARLKLLLGAKDSTDKGLIANVRKDGRISAGGIPCATNTGRTIHSVVVNIPKTSKLYGQELRELFTCDEGRLLVGCDASGIQWRIAAHYIKHPEVIEIVSTGDIHEYVNQIARLDNREIAKQLGFGILFGGGVNRVAIITGRSEKEAATIRTRIINDLPGLRDFIDRVKLACKKGYLLGLDGRKLQFRKVYSAPNLLIQSAEAIIMKTASVIIQDEIEQNKWDAYQVGMFHDEFIFDCENKNAKYLTSKAIDAIKLAGVKLGLRCPLDAKAQMGRNWAEVH